MTTTTSPRIDDANDLLHSDLDAQLEKLTLGIGRAAGRRPHAKGQPRFHTIVACIDGSERSENVLAWTRQIALWHQARVIVASVAAPSIPTAGLSTFYAAATGVEEAFRHAEVRLRAQAEEAAQRLRAGGIEADTVVTTGSIAHALADIANTHRADLVILGSHGGGTLSRVALGSVGNAILDRVAASVLVARTSPPHGKILAATDGSAASYRAVAYALRQAELSGAEVLVQHVVELPEGTAQIPSAGLLRDVISRMQLESHPRVSYQLDAGRPGERILAKAEEAGADLIVVGSRGLGNVFGFLVGSVSHKVVNGASASVLVVKDV